MVEFSSSPNTLYKLIPIYETVSNQSFVHYTIVINKGVFIIRLTNSNLVELYLCTSNPKCRILSISEKRVNKYQFINGGDIIVRDDGETYVHNAENCTTTRRSDGRIYSSFNLVDATTVPELLYIVCYFLNKEYSLKDFTNCTYSHGFDLTTLDVISLQNCIKNINKFMSDSNVDKLSIINNVKSNMYFKSYINNED